jgi:pseudaminic acid cytidylyltransferase
MSNICIIPARGGSKRILNKNLKLFAGKPIIEYSIRNAITSNIFDKIIVSTDSEEIKSLAIKLGAEVPFLRNKKASNDEASIEEACFDVLNKINKNYKYICCLFATAPLLNNEIILNSYKKLKSSKYNSICPIIKFDKNFERSLKIQNEKIIWNNSQFSKSNSQEFADNYYDAGQFYFSKVKSLFKTKDFINENTGYVELNKYEFVDIDNISDWHFAEKLFRINNK